MPQFKRVFSKFLRLHPKFNESHRQRGVVTPIANTASTYREPNSLHKRGHLGAESTDQNVQLSIDTVPEDAEDVEESEDEDEGKVRKTHFEVEVQNVELSTDTIPEKIEEVKEYEDGDSFDEYDEDEEDEDVPRVFSYDLARKTHNEMMTQRLYVAVTDDDREIAALRTLYREKFNHIVRVVFEPLSRHDNITPSSWTIEEINPDDGPSELRLTCPSLTLNYSDKLTALTEKQLLAARNYITQALPSGDDAWAPQEVEFKHSREECKGARVLIVGPPDRSVDVMAILVCYMAFLTASRADDLLAGLRKLSLAHSYWGGDILGKDSLDLADQVSRKKLKW